MELGPYLNNNYSTDETILGGKMEIFIHSCCRFAEIWWLWMPFESSELTVIYIRNDTEFKMIRALWDGDTW